MHDGYKIHAHFKTHAQCTIYLLTIFSIFIFPIRKTCPYNMQRIFVAFKIENFVEIISIVLIYLVKTVIVGTR